MKTVIISAFILLNVILEATLFQFLTIGSIKPDFIIVLIVSYAILEGGAYSSVIGLASGLLVDILFGQILGVNALSYMAAGYILGQANENVFKDSILPPALLNFAAIIIYQHMYFLIMYLTGSLLDEGISYVYVLFRVILPQGIYNAVLGAVIYRYYLHLSNSKLMQNKLY